MGSSKDTYLGPYVEVRPKQETIKVEIDTCEQDTCNNHGKNLAGTGAFCSLCGSRVYRLLKDKQKEIGAWEFVHDDEIEVDTFFVPEWVDDGQNKTIILPNRYPDGVSWNENTLVISGERIDGETKEFSRHYAKELKKFLSFFGYEGYCVKWGLVQYAH